MNSIKDAEPQIKNLIDRMKKNKEEHKNPMKIFSKEEEKNDDRPIPGKLGPPELSKEKKNQMMERMISARQNLQKNGLFQDIIKQTSQAILSKARNLEETLNKNIPTVFNGDSDVKQTHLRVNSDYNVFNIINKSVLRECGTILNLQTIEQGKKALIDMMMNKPLRQTTKPSMKKFEV